MARRWLLGVLASTALTIGLGTGAAVAQELPLTGSSDPVTVEVPEVGTVTVEADPDTSTVSVEADASLEASEDTASAPTVEAELSPEGPAVDVSAPIEVAGESVPVDEVIAPVEEAVGETTESLPADPAPAPAPAPAPSSSRAAGDDDVTPAAEPAPQVAPRATLPPAVRTQFAVTDRAATVPAAEVAPPAEELAPQVAPPAADTTTELALPIVDTTPTVPAALRLLAGLMVLGAAATWRKVQAEIA